MRAKCFASFFIVIAFACCVPFSVAVANSELNIFGMLFTGMPTIPNTGGKLQTALKHGDTTTLQISVHSSVAYPPDISADLSDLGILSPTTTPAIVGSPNALSNSYYNFGPFAIGTDVSDGLKIISVTASDSDGNSATATTSIKVDNALPIAILSTVTFSATSPKGGDYMYLSGNVNGTGSIAKASQIVMNLFSSAGVPIVSKIIGGSTFNYSTNSFNTALSSSQDGSFSNIPIQLMELGDTGWISRADDMRVDIFVYDEAGNFASTSLKVAIPKTPPPDPCIAAGNCVSNVLFLPGIQGSRLYEETECGVGSEEKLWEPIGESIIKILHGAGDDKVRNLLLDDFGKSVCSEIYVRSGDVIDSVVGGNIYKSFIDEMNGLKSDGTISDWKPIAYDWRLSLDDLLSNGAERDGKIYYSEATSTPYIEQTLRALAESSKTGKISIVSHSNGGLVAKALLNKLGSSASKSLVDKVIMVGAPQSGAPKALGVLLVGYDAGIYAGKVLPIVSNTIAKELAENSPMAYHLLPSQNYFDSVVDDTNHPVASFAGDAYSSEISSYGSIIDNLSELDDFILASTTLHSSLVDYANSTHSILDNWAPPDEIEISQIAGWGADTIAGIDFYTLPPISALASFDPTGWYRPIFTEDGDGTVPVPSALMMASSTNVKRYWVNLEKFNREQSSNREHKDLFEISQLNDFIKNIIKNSTSTLQDYISTTQPQPTSNKKLIFFLHSPLTLQLTDSSGNITGLAEDDSMTQDIPDSSYGEFGDVKFIIAPEGNYQLTMHGQASGTFSLDMQEISGGIVAKSTTIANVPTTENTLASLTISGGIESVSALSVDKNGDGASVITITPIVGQYVNYVEPSPPEPDPVINSGGGGGGVNFLYPISTTTTSFVSTSSAQMSSSQTETASPVVIASSTVAKQFVENAPILKATTRPEQTETEKIVKDGHVISQTASVYDAVSQQSFFARWGNAFYNILYGFWNSLKTYFDSK